MLDGVSFRTLKPGDPAECEALARIHEVAPRHWIADHQPHPEAIRLQAEFFLAQAGHVDSLHLIAELAGEIVGFHWVDRDPEGAHIRSLWVDERLQGRGLARALKERGEAWARERGARSIRTSVHFRNRRMLAFNLKCGFEPGFVQMSKPL